MWLWGGLRHEARTSGGLRDRGVAHSSCLESLCGDFLYIAVLIIGAVRQSNHNLCRYDSTTSTCNVPLHGLSWRQRQVRGGNPVA